MAMPLPEELSSFLQSIRTTRTVLLRRQQHQHRPNMRFTALSVVAFLAGADAFGVSSQQSIRKPAFTSSTAIQGVKNPPANESTPAKALVSTPHVGRF